MQFNIPAWKTAPFIRLLIPLIVGIMTEWYLQIPLLFIIVAFCFFTIISLLFQLLSVARRYKLQWLQGLFITLLIVSVGSFITWQKDIRHQHNWFGNNYQAEDYLVIKINEPPVDKSKSLKADGIVQSLIHNDSAFDCNGKIFLYFAKDSASQLLHYGDEIIIHKTLQPVKNSGNPGAFNYERFAAFQQTFHTVYLKEGDWVLLNEKNINRFDQFIFSLRDKILSIIGNAVGEEKDKQGVAEALLIGYQNDLDKDIQQAYSNTGVVHIIARSGMSMGLIYFILSWILSRIPFIKKSEFTKTIIILSCLWLFALLTSASATVLRSAVVFSCILAGKVFNKKTSIYNSLAVSAFLLLCFNPFLLWDAGFQLSYFAVTSIVVFQRPIYNLFYVKNRWLDRLWKFISVTLAVQVLIFPICIYHFHQFPVLFLITNMITFPLAIVILIAEILLLLFYRIPLLDLFFGKIVLWYTSLMNKFIVWMNSLFFSVIDNIPSSVLSTYLLYATVIFFAAYFINKKKIAFKAALCFLLAFVIVMIYGNWAAKKQSKVIVYNVPQHEAIDIIDGNNYQFMGDSVMLEDALLQNFHLKPARIELQLTNRTDSIQDNFQQGNFLQLGNKRVLIVDKKISFIQPSAKINVDIIVISKNPKVRIADLAHTFNCNQYVVDASNSLWKIDNWKKECEKLHLPLYSIPDKGAFILNVE